MIDCRNYALRLITIKDRTEKEIRGKLSEKGFEENIIEDEIAFLKDYGYIDDASYVKHITNDAINLKKWGKLRIRTELFKRGIDRETVDNTLADAFFEDCTDKIAQQLESRFKNSDLSNLKERTRIFNYFLRRGYTAEEIKGAINRACSFCDILTDEY